ncbi:MAG: leucine-rich repeat domain-containing protein [Clostridiales Family XIII bacterium]|jgi:uncharacterized repeat protein (TIGR02543 family)|nr:leucine-rich repeat domain-containing protein [Clostridiales Family XIII bacterium]
MIKETSSHTKKIIVNLLAIMLMFVGVIGFTPAERVNADTKTEDGFVYEIKGDDSMWGKGAYVIDYIGSKSSITIPKTLGEIDVVSVNLDKNLPENVTSASFLECIEIKYINVSQSKVENIILGNNLKELEYLVLYNNSQLISLDLIGLENLTYLFCSNNKITSLDLTGLTALEYLNCSVNQLKNLDLIGLTSLKSLWCNNNFLTTLALDGLDKLKTLCCHHNYIIDETLLNSFVSSFGEENVLPQYGYDLFILSFNLNGGIGIYQDRETLKGNLANLPPNSPTKENYSFDGWWTSKTGGIEIVANSIIKKNMTLYARWILNTPTPTPVFDITTNSPAKIVNDPVFKHIVRFITSVRYFKKGKTNTIKKLTSYKNVTVKSTKVSFNYRKFVTVKKTKNGLKVKVSKKIKDKAKFSIKVTLKNGNTKTLKIRIK